jgi:nucleotide-binding universal stress UspA family protein
MMVGVAETHDAEGAFEPKITKLIKEFQGDVAIMASRGVGRVQNLGQDLRILVPINGSPIARRAAEIAIAIARPTRAHVTALYVSSNGQKRRGRIAARSHEEGALREIAELGERYEVQVLTALETKSSADKAILNRATKGYGLIVMGASQRPGDEVFFGNTANAILKKWKGAVLLVAT